MSSYKSTQIDIENNARMFIRTGDTEIEINVKPIEVKAEYEKDKIQIQKADEFYKNSVINEKSEYAKEDMDDYNDWMSPRKENNSGLVMTNRCSGKTVQSLLLIVSDKNSVLIVPYNYMKGHCETLLEEFGFNEETIRDTVSRIYSATEIKDKDTYNRLANNYSLHADNIELVMYQLGYSFKSFTTSNLLVSGFTHEFNKAEEVCHD
ncbi:hypothetical protein P3U41_06225 [Mammaliicoccus sciuri]|uniref:hypothetical protein n=1 Tax=Mammaliicoccus sciuri TaxID=1296 RepID=UPI002B2619D4|nr:hypothetical protein [Mammaliicoccus sciuri]WQL34368.1 hypothetical protein P3U41_06225 [Mammaliicoccus sciuri]WQL61307.1 hypothetical protein P3T96_06225 [Mammaliicoccus sciuri]